MAAIAGAGGVRLLDLPLISGYVTAMAEHFRAGGAMLDSKYIGRMCRYHRKRAGLTRVQLADLCGIGKTALFDMENGKPTMRFDTLASVLAGLNITPNWNSPLMAEFLEVEDA